MNQTIDTILNHHSVRKFTDEELTQEQIRLLVEAAQSASTSSFVQAYSIIGVKDKEKKKKLASLAGNQQYVENNGHLFIFCADLYRHTVAAEMEGKKEAAQDSIESTEKFMVSLIDAALASQNMAIAAESLGLGICYIGGIRNNLVEVSQLLKTPDHVLPLFALVVGYPDQQTEKSLELLFIIFIMKINMSRMMHNIKKDYRNIMKKSQLIIRKEQMEQDRIRGLRKWLLILSINRVCI